MLALHETTSRTYNLFYFPVSLSTSKDGDWRIWSLCSMVQTVQFFNRLALLQATQPHDQTFTPQKLILLKKKSDVVALVSIHT